MIIADVDSGRFVAGRDPIGVRPLFIGHSADGATWLCSEAKGIAKYCTHVEQFTPVCLFVCLFLLVACSYLSLTLFFFFLTLSCQGSFYVASMPGVGF